MITHHVCSEYDAEFRRRVFFVTHVVTPKVTLERSFTNFVEANRYQVFRQEQEDLRRWLLKTG